MFILYGMTMTSKYQRMTFAAAVFGDLEAIQYLYDEEIDENPLTPQRIEEKHSFILDDVCYILAKESALEGTQVGC